MLSCLFSFYIFRVCVLDAYKCYSFLVNQTFYRYELILLCLIMPLPTTSFFWKKLIYYVFLHSFNSAFLCILHMSLVRSVESDFIYIHFVFQPEEFISILSVLNSIPFNIITDIFGFICACFSFPHLFNVSSFFCLLYNLLSTFFSFFCF